MKWDLIGKLAVRAIPNIIELVERRKMSGKKEVAIELIKDEIADLKEEGVDILNHPKVAPVLEKAVNIMVELQNAIATVKNET